MSEILIGNFGTKEWAQKTVNLIKGCSHNCIYCYGLANAVRFKRCTPDEWCNEIIRQKKLTAGIRPKTCSLMYPSTHDITPTNLYAHLIYLDKLLAAYPSVLIVSKPHRECIQAICQRYSQYRDKITFRFTIGSADDAILKIWELHAPSLAERLDCLRYAYERGFKTSVSCEPMLDNNIEEVLRIVRPFVNDTIWIGKMNRLIPRLKKNGHDNPEIMARAEELLEWQSDANIHNLYQRLKDDPQIRWKDSIKKVVGLEGPK